MTQKNVLRGTYVYLLPLFAALGLAAVCQAQSPPRSRDQLRAPVYRVAKTAARPETTTPQVKEHPLAPALRIASARHKFIQEHVRDYECMIIKRERVNGKLGEQEFMFARIRNEQTQQGRVVVPFSVYLYFTKPDRIKGREVLYVKGRNKNQLVAHEGGIAGFLTVSLNPDSFLAMRGQRYPITEIGLENLIRKLIEVAEEEMKYGECEVNFFKDAKIKDRVCTCIEVIHPVRRKEFRFHKARSRQGPGSALRPGEKQQPVSRPRRRTRRIAHGVAQSG